MLRLRIAAATLAAMTAVSALAQAPAAPSEAGQTAAQHFKNIQVLKDVPADELIPAMRFITGALGVECDFCHEEDRSKDTKKEKNTARDMMKMMKNINDTSFEGRMEVTCATCHQGRSHPMATAPMATLASIQERIAAEQQHQHGQGGEAAAGEAAKTPAVPTADQLFAKYEEAIGGDAAIAKLTSSHIVATGTTATGQTIKLESYREAEGNKVWSQQSNPRFSRVSGYDGTQAWAKDREVHPLSGLEAESLQVDGNFYRNLRLKPQYGMARTFPIKQKVGDKDAYVVRAAVKGRRFTDMLYFDVNTGLLLRRVTLARTALGQIPTTVDYDTYQDVDGVKVATGYTQSTPQNEVKVHVDEIKFNVPVDDAKFAMPKQEPPAK